MTSDKSMGLRLALSTIAAGARVVRRSGQVFSPVGLTRFAVDMARTRSHGMTSIIHLHALTDPRRPAVVSGRNRFTYGELDARVNRIAHGLKRRGVVAGDRVAMLLRNGHEYLEVNGALSYLDATSVQVGYRLKAHEVAYVLKNSGARALIFHGDFAPTVEEAIREAGNPSRELCFASPASPGFYSYDELLVGGDPDMPPRASGEGGGGVMVYTSGTTGKPKGARRSFKDNHFETVIHFIDQVPLRRDERHLVVCPLYHSAAPAFVAITFGLGGCNVVMEHFEPEDIPRVIERERITSSVMVPTMLHRLLELGTRRLRQHDLSSLRALISAAAPLPTELARRVEETFGPVLYNFYGATETGFVTLAKPGEHTARPGTIGRLVPGNEIRLLDAAGNDVRDGEVGELYVRSRMLMAGYHDDPEATKKALKEGFVSVGDLAWRDADGYYYLADRKTDMVISAGVNIYPLEIEQRLHEHPAVADAAIVGVPDAEWGESLAAFIVLRKGSSTTPDELRAWVGQTLADYKRPRSVRFVDELPRNPTGKVLKRELRAMAAAEAGSGKRA